MLLLINSLGFIYAIAFSNAAVLVPQPINTYIDLCHLLVSNSDNYTDFTLVFLFTSLLNCVTNTWLSGY
jgi:hypothetical protein